MSTLRLGCSMPFISALLFPLCIALAASASAAEDKQLTAATELRQQADDLMHQGRYGESEPLYRRAFAIVERSRGADSIEVATIVNQLALVYREQGRYGEAEPLLKRSLAIRERVLGPQHLDVAQSLDNLGGVYLVQGRYGEAEPLARRALEIEEKALGPKHPRVATSLNNLAYDLRRLGRYADAEPLAKRALAIAEQTLGPDSETTGGYLTNLAALYLDQGRVADAEPLAKRGLAAREKALGADHPDVAYSLTDLGQIYSRLGRLDEALPLYQRALALREKALGPGNPYIAQSQINLAHTYRRLNKWDEAVAAMRRSIEVLIRHLSVEAGQRSAAAVADQRGYRSYFLDYIPLVIQQALNETQKQAGDPAVVNKLRRAATGDTFRVAQMAQVSSAGAAVASAAVRAAAGNDKRAALVRERQDVAQKWQQLDAAVVRAASRPAADRQRDEEASLRTALDQASKRLDTLDAEIATAFPGYAELSNPQPLTADEAQALLAPDEALLLYVTYGEGVYVWVVRRDGVTFYFKKIALKELTGLVTTLRSRLDPELNPDFSPFPTGPAYSLYQHLVGSVKSGLAGIHHLLIVPDGPLQSLPFGVLVTEPPKQEPARPEDYRDIAWLARDYAISVLPSVSSLRGLRQFANAEHASVAFLGVGNPVLAGNSGSARGVRIAALFRGGTADVDKVRALPPLPETADELRAIARSVGGSEQDLLLGERASEPVLRGTPLDHYRAIAFATHGLMSGDLRGLAEPALVLTPPAVATPENDGLLTASKIATLKLNTDWVVLSACNTAAGDGTPDGGGLSGLAKAFFYAGARSLLVSHWPVWSQATVALTTGTFTELSNDPKIGRAEALRRAEMAMLDPKNPPEFAHPLAWAPFVLAGEGGAGR
jgi:CHAT domain-containing protein/tetratricopeptide (TPR) repeat protein